MKKQHIKHIIAGLMLSVTLSFNPLARAAEKEEPKETKIEEKADKPEADRAPEGRKLPFHGKLSAFDAKEKTITITYSTGDKVFHVTPETEILKYEKAAKLDEAVVGEQVSGAYIKQGDRAMLTKLSLAKHHEAKPEGSRKTAKTAKEKEKDKSKAKP